MIIDVVVRGVDEIKLLCSLHEVVISDEVMVSYVNEKGFFFFWRLPLNDDTPLDVGLCRLETRYSLPTKVLWLAAWLVLTILGGMENVGGIWCRSEGLFGGLIFPVIFPICQIR